MNWWHDDDYGSRIHKQNKQCLVHQALLEALMLKNILFFSSEKSLLHDIVQSMQNMVFSPTMPFNFWTSLVFACHYMKHLLWNCEWLLTLKAQFQVSKYHLSVVYTRSAQDIFILMFCTSLEQCDVNVGCMCWTALRTKLPFFLKFYCPES